MVRTQKLAFLTNVNGITINIILLSQMSLPALMLALNSEMPLPLSWNSFLLLVLMDLLSASGAQCLAGLKCKEISWDAKPGVQINITKEGQVELDTISWKGHRMTCAVWLGRLHPSLNKGKYQTNAKWETCCKKGTVTFKKMSVSQKTKSQGVVPDYRRLERYGNWMQYVILGWVPIRHNRVN